MAVTIYPSQVNQILHSVAKCPSKLSPCFKGDPGIGKTEGIYQFARETGRNVVEIIASQILPNEVSGITMPVPETHSMEIFDHARLSSLRDGDVLFFDELLQASPQVLSACLTLIQERRLMSGKMLPDVMIVAATNPLPSPNNIPLSIRQRFMFIDVAWNKNEWSSWVRKSLKCSPTDSLLKLIRTDDQAEYNVLTPRTAAKLIEWGQKTQCDEGWTMSVRNMFDDITRRALEETIGNVSEQLRIRNILEPVFPSPSAELLKIFDGIEDIDLSELLDLLEATEEWSEIEKILKVAY